MARKTATGELTVIAEGYIAYSCTEKSDLSGLDYHELGRYDGLDEALEACKGKGRWGADYGVVKSYSVELFEGGVLRLTEEEIVGDRWLPGRHWSSGFLDLRDYEFGLRPAREGALRPAAQRKYGMEEGFAVEGKGADRIIAIDPTTVRSMLIDDPDGLVGLWRRAGDRGWRGEFQGRTHRELDIWLPLRREPIYSSRGSSRGRRGPQTRDLA